MFHLITHGVGQSLRDLPFGHAGLGLHDRSDTIYTAFGVDKGAILLEEGGSWQKYVCKLGGLIQKQILDNDTLHITECCLNVLGVRVRLCDVFSLYVYTLKVTCNRGVQHVGNAITGFVVNRDAPVFIKCSADDIITDGAITGQFMWERAHVTGTLDIILSAERINAHAHTTDVAGRHGEVGHCHDHGRTLAVFGDPKAVINRSIVCAAIKSRCSSDNFSVDTGDLSDGFWRILFLFHELQPLVDRLCITPFSNEVVIKQALRHHYMGEAIHDGHVGAG